MRSAATGILGAGSIAILVTGYKAFLHSNASPSVTENKYIMILFFSLVGNAYEELLFRGMLQANLMRLLPPIRTIIASGLIFSLCHAFLATTVTNVGLPIFVFTITEGLVTAFVYYKSGLLGATMSHGLAIFLLAIGAY